MKYPDIAPLKLQHSLSFMYTEADRAQVNTAASIITNKTITFAQNSPSASSPRGRCHNTHVITFSSSTYLHSSMETDDGLPYIFSQPIRIGLTLTTEC